MSACLKASSKTSSNRAWAFAQQSVPPTMTTASVGGPLPLPGTSRQGRHQQRYSASGERLVAGCIPVRFVGDGSDFESVQVLMISSGGGKGLVFPKGGWEADESVEAAARRETMEEAGVRGTLEEPVLGPFPFRSNKPGLLPTLPAAHTTTTGSTACTTTSTSGTAAGPPAGSDAQSHDDGSAQRALLRQHSSNSGGGGGGGGGGGSTTPTGGGAGAACLAHMFVMHVAEELAVWPEQGERERAWVGVAEASRRCRHQWMRDALHQWAERRGWAAALHASLAVAAAAAAASTAAAAAASTAAASAAAATTPAAIGGGSSTGQQQQQQPPRPQAVVVRQDSLASNHSSSHSP